MTSPMVSMGPFKHDMAWVAYRFTSTVLDDIWPSVFFFTGIATSKSRSPKMQCIFLSTNVPVQWWSVTRYYRVLSGLVQDKQFVFLMVGCRNSLANLTTICRQLAMLIWIHVPNALPPKEEEPKPTQPDSQPLHDSPPTPTTTPKRPFATGCHFPTPISGPAQKPSAELDPSPSRSDSSLASTIETDLAEYDIGDGWRAVKEKEDERMKKQTEEMKERQSPQAKVELHGLIKKKSYIGLVQAFDVSMKHALRGETVNGEAGARTNGKDKGWKAKEDGYDDGNSSEILVYISSYLADLNRRALISPTTSTAIMTTLLEL
ncbi:hypothetical protein C361_06114 [Cryptococcus neoformans Tu259-1]|uniref:Uncharacterized protein n=1 Tax=Cryptococcus neoformans Tu259-1 TaxID=1230072 RepID=A0A854QC09_CRYNE|nr:hypothetical protein C361_06114 [Cryptococcus neoformans var. grubii Tu259-1]